MVNVFFFLLFRKIEVLINYILNLSKQLFFTIQLTKIIFFFKIQKQAVLKFEKYLRVSIFRKTLKRVLIIFIAVTNFPRVA